MFAVFTYSGTQCGLLVVFFSEGHIASISSRIRAASYMVEGNRLLMR